jgi:hypothetical protein
MKRVLVSMAAAALMACGGSSESAPDWPRLEDLWSVAGTTYTCRSPTGQGSASSTDAWCSWERVLVDGAPACWAIVQLARPDASGAWTAAVHRSSATCY